jgi:tetratricopeptide (TPR) repeat protein
MLGVTRTAALSIALIALAGLSGATETQPSQEILDQLDPTRAAMALCAERDGKRRSAMFLAAGGMANAAVPTAGFVAFVPGLPDLGFEISTQRTDVQRYFNQGLLLTYGFNHFGAARAFREAQRLDPNCAMCWWGEALAFGPNINAPMDAALNGRVIEALAEANRLKHFATPVERGLIEALSLRYSSRPDADRAALDRAYATAMFDLARQFPAHDDVALLAAEAEMDTRPWDYWEADKKTPKGRIAEAVALVEAVLTRNPGHPQAEHLYIHLMENSDVPRKAEAAADRLAASGVTGAGHLVHMPSHIYYVLGRFKDSLNANVAAARADEAYFKLTGERGLYRFGYYPHNIHFILTSAQMAGDRRIAMQEAARLQGLLDPETTAAIPWLQAVEAAPYFAAAQFDSPEKILRQPPPADKLPYVTAMWHYARAVAFARLRQEAPFRHEVAEIRHIRATADFKAMTDALMPAPELLQLAETVAEGRFAYSQGRFNDAAGHYRAAAAIEDGIWYMEPPYWYFPVRQALGAALYRSGDLLGARQAYQQALVQYPTNGWALFGLAQVHRALDDRLNEAATRAAFNRAWSGDRNWLTVDRI